MKRISKSVVLSAIVLSIISSGFVGCKKGDKDPFISLRSRKARVVGDWKVSKYTSSTASVSGGGSTSTDSYSFDGSTFTETYTSSGSTSTNVAVGTWTYKFEKDGKYSMSSASTQSGNTSSYTESGTWNFTGGIGKDVKKKSQIVLTTLSTTRSTSGGTTYSNSDTYTGADAPIQILQLVELRNKEMIIKMDGSNVSVSVYSGSSSTSSDNTTAEMTLKQ